MAYEDKLIEYHNKALDTEAAGDYLDPVVTYQEQIPFQHHQGYVPDLFAGFSDYGIQQFPELSKTGHFDFNEFLAQHPELQGRSDVYNVLGGMDVAERIKPGDKKFLEDHLSGGYDWSDPYSLSALGGVYALKDSILEPAQDWKEGFADWYRNVKGIGIQRDALSLLYDKDEADYYKGYYKKMQKDYKKMQADRWQKDNVRQLKDVIRGTIVGGTIDRPGRIPPVKIRKEKIMPSGDGGGGWSPGAGAEQRGSNAPGFTDPGEGSYGPWKSKGGIVNLL
jgi:hypothetical protein